MGVVSSSGSNVVTSSSGSVELLPLAVIALSAEFLITFTLTVLDVCVSKLNLSEIKVLLSSISSAIFFSLLSYHISQNKDFFFYPLLIFHFSIFEVLPAGDCCKATVT